MSPPSTHTGGLLKERAQAPEGAHLGHADGSRLFAEGHRHLGRRQAADDPQLEQITRQVGVSEATVGKRDQAGIHARVERGPRFLIALTGPLNEVSRPLPLVHVTLPLRRMGWKCHISATFLPRATRIRRKRFSPWK